MNTKKLPDFGIELSQITKSSHVTIKEIINQHIFIDVDFDKICIYLKMF